MRSTKILNRFLSNPKAISMCPDRFVACLFQEVSNTYIIKFFKKNLKKKPPPYYSQMVEEFLGGPRSAIIALFLWMISDPFVRHKDLGREHEPGVSQDEVTVRDNAKQPRGGRDRAVRPRTKSAKNHMREGQIIKTSGENIHSGKACQENSPL